ncbi:MAG TPA: hypothetical protein VLF95_10300, partial [Vicinamibacteria bacterium]|nr:hypothetical protein [Vicinamibacteria bacterium]
LFAEALGAGESRPHAREVLSRAADEQVLASALRRAVPAAFLEEVACTRPWSERPRVLARVVLSPRAPQALSLRLVSGLYWRDLAEVAATPRVPAAVRSRAESLLRDGLAEMRLGDRVTLARLATPALLPVLLADSERQVAESALLNPRLREEDVAAALRREDVKTVLVEATVVSSRWATNYAVRLALVLQPRTPLPLALQQISSLVPRDLRRVAAEARLRPLVRAAAREVLAEPRAD